MAQVPTDRPIDGVDQSPCLLGRHAAIPPNALAWADREIR